VNYNNVGTESLKDIYEVDYFLFFPDMRVKQYWDMLIMLLVVVSSVITPWRLAFVESDDSLWWFILDTAMDLLFLCDIFVNFFTVYTNQHEDYETARAKIAWHYIKGWFLFDVISVLPINYLFEQGQGVNDLARLVRLTRLYKMVKIFRIIKQSGKVKRYAVEVLKIGMVIERALTFLMVIGIITHVFACLWYFLARWNDFSPDTWVAQENYHNESDFTKYIFCFYFIIQVLTTVGYGDMTIVSSSEKILAIFIMMVGVITFSFAFGSLMSVLSNLNSKGAKLKAKSFELNSIKKKYKLPAALYNKLYKG
jgi:hypothetical protein